MSVAPAASQTRTPGGGPGITCAAPPAPAAGRRADLVADPHPDAVGQFDLDRAAESERRWRAAESRRLGSASPRRPADAATRTGTNSDVGSATSRPSRACRRHWNTRLRYTPCRAATSATWTPGASHSARMRSLSATLQRRRRSRPVMISTVPLPMTLQPTLRPTLRPPASTNARGQGRRAKPAPITHISAALALLRA